MRGLIGQLFYLSIFCLYVNVEPQISQVADFFVFGGGVVDSRFKTFRFFDSKRELFEKLASELKNRESGTKSSGGRRPLSPERVRYLVREAGLGCIAILLNKSLPGNSNL